MTAIKVHGIIFGVFSGILNYIENTKAVYDMVTNDFNEKANRLIHEKSPYLLQHAHNPIDWYPWTEEAFEKAREEDKPIFLSIGYSTCRWCHNMNRDCFQDEEVAELLNRYFVSIKVDREERPDIDNVYMTFAEAISGSAGWPLTLLLTPEKKPFFAGTYFPKRSRKGMIGLIDLLEKVKNLWQTRRRDLIEESNQILKIVDTNYNTLLKGNIDKDILNKAKNELESIFDEEFGGFSKRPKFPLPQYILFLLEYGKKFDDPRALGMAKFTLENMYKGGIFDHVGFGFYRYSVDNKWLVPHFEKMLYDNALLGMVYTRAYEITGETLYRDVAVKIYQFVLSELTSEEGGFYSALDAETEGEEGKYYTFTYNEIINLLGEEFGKYYCEHYNITEEGNFEGKNIPNLIGKDLKSITFEEMSKLDSIRDMILIYREKRTKPFRDEKILTSWNGLMISSLAYGGKVFDNRIFIRKAKEAADFAISNLIDKEGNLLSIYVDGKSYNYGLLEDYSFFIYGLLSLHDVIKDKVYLEISKKLTDDMLELFEEEGALCHYSSLSEPLIIKSRPIYDGAIPSGNAFALLVLGRLYKFTNDKKYYETAEEIIKSYGGDINKNPIAYMYSILSLLI